MKLNIAIGAVMAASGMLAMGGASAALIDPDGPGGVGAFNNAPVNAASLDFPAGNIIATCLANCTSATDLAQGDILQIYGHNTVSGILNSDGQNLAPFLGTPPGSESYEWTLSFGFAELVTSVTPTDLDGVVLGPGTGTNFFELYFDPASNASNLQGTGFQDGTLILSGTIRGFEGAGPFGLTDFSVNGTTANDPVTGATNGQLDDFGTDNYANVFGAGTTIESITGSGGASVKADVLFQNTDFFISDLSTLFLSLRTDQFLPYTFTNPSSCFYDAPSQGTPGLTGAGLNSAGGGGCGDGKGATAGGTIGAFNGATGPNVMFETDGRATFAVSEPATLALLGMSFVAMGAAGNRRKRKG